MPIYDFKCTDCGKIAEIFIKTSGQAARCPDCGGSNMERLMSASYLIKMGSNAPSSTCCGRSERCETPSCSTGEGCRRS
ncbi:MAG: zinc ribbon domain-containing protein [Dehalococcoidia bacterium]|nr:zinc ribbon domain-containing protein [Dehalococcoidia bacterium]